MLAPSHRFPADCSSSPTPVFVNRLMDKFATTKKHGEPEKKYGPKNEKYTSSAIQNEMIDTFACMVREEIAECVRACQHFSVQADEAIVDLTFRITTCRSLLAIAFRACDLVCINLSFASRDFVYPRMTSIRIRFCPSAWTPRFQRDLCIASARTTLAVSAVAPS